MPKKILLNELIKKQTSLDREGRLYISFYKNLHFVQAIRNMKTHERGLCIHYVEFIVKINTIDVLNYWI